MKLSFLSLFKHKPVPPAPTVSQNGIKARAIRHLIAKGTITAWEVQQMGTTDARKMFTEMRQAGLLFPADDACGHHDAPNASGKGRHRVHHWTRKVPESWLKPNVERRKTPRGERS
jgi:hypothetical protein